MVNLPNRPDPRITTVGRLNCFKHSILDSVGRFLPFEHFVLLAMNGQGFGKLLPAFYAKAKSREEHRLAASFNAGE